ncbi:hypothetical protein F751_4015 [Auxenochlorella protothecoides]|uniref:Uncharacterized protein n=1 Tax=Auxenochlorella protothecoides TaxID=3075 RepID=A0A087SE36_AUXPR|nr:hypothetical protein F751_4015 [Auxenochlorella protothecoides]KFM23990.1 hypothetical protein F751_4015 [Auxenochlorella protothecoides]
MHCWATSASSWLSTGLGGELPAGAAGCGVRERGGAGPCQVGDGTPTLPA